MESVLSSNNHLACIGTWVKPISQVKNKSLNSETVTRMCVVCLTQTLSSRILWSVLKLCVTVLLNNYIQHFIAFLHVSLKNIIAIL